MEAKYSYTKKRKLTLDCKSIDWRLSDIHWHIVYFKRTVFDHYAAFCE